MCHALLQKKSIRDQKSTNVCFIRGSQDCKLPHDFHNCSLFVLSLFRPGSAMSCPPGVKLNHSVKEIVWLFAHFFQFLEGEIAWQLTLSSRRERDLKDRTSGARPVFLQRFLWRYAQRQRKRNRLLLAQPKWGLTRDIQTQFQSDCEA